MKEFTFTIQVFEDKEAECFVGKCLDPKVYSAGVDEAEALLATISALGMYLTACGLHPETDRVTSHKTAVEAKSGAGTSTTEGE